MFGKVNPQELVTVHSLDLNIVHWHVQWSAAKLWTLASCAVENSIYLVLRLLSVRLQPEAHVVHSICHCGLAIVKVQHLAVVIETSNICLLVTFCIYLILEVTDIYALEDRPENGSLWYPEFDINKLILFIINLNELFSARHII